ncbi:4-(cytidine 5'-diphospho)-2-C-methyl-D-erythritol kinase [Sandaracinobacter sp. RS1-74]|uniref:4-(cytidine 5'-diphospho)-2-C-methyl-D-erythritol kinase n=1 Tax=Sandaracinobacteroides sayramensis TaxID=2913411 RepID=UPI001EDADD14|nr:4-(cytidine 5'-diphospho)-2-C-methyl-D-erythritol kinase [Sandaracinobacteroides sayramensis]MCG2839917.1 4-(cytidine 5'-diphospho)-2-C-methyl-D-erythritol kinase [Sandaracinobacteroides sayramensis]
MTLPIAGVEGAPAKINLALHVRRRRADGYHELETLFAFTRFGDRLEAEPAEDWSLEVSGPMAGAAGPLVDNLVLRAARAFAAETGWRARYVLRLEKRIPVAAGLGGGSADAGAALRLLNRLAGAPLGEAALERIGAGLGADVPACVRSRTARGVGVGEGLAEAQSVAGLGVLLVNPRVPVPTGPVFKAWDGVDRGPLDADWRAARNDLEAPAIALQPVIAEVLGWLRGLPGVSLARMSGSGATSFALFDGPVPEVQVPSDWWSAATELL